MIRIIISIITSLLAGFLGAWAGAENTSKVWRRFGIPILITGLAIFYLKSWVCLGILIMIIPLSIGYGIPWGTPVHGDMGSYLGRVWYKIINRNTNYAEEQNVILNNICVRATIGFMIVKSLIFIPIIKHNWFVYILYGLGIILVNGLISWRNLGKVRLFDKLLSNTEFVVYLLLVFFASLMIF